ncbi:O-antigen ligase family protein [Salirhabdus sp. Marseille-P4669]|uniref:O-antigen ligase family protein n=1 Tax=Salirhabdus sp. Marseille-P4669 TaxID=2042310 RepID=UPI000C7E1C39|nr:O-antigen ligase family protein [Salirhabdus sp. Marseille-P4669]
MNPLTKQINFLLIRLLVLFIPFLFHLDMVVYLNVSLADIVLGILLLGLLCDKENRVFLATVSKKYHLILIYMLLLIYFCSVSMLSYFAHYDVNIPYGFSAILKLSFNFLYVITFLVLLERYKEEILTVILKSWKFAAGVISLLCILSVVLYRMGIDNGLTLGGRAQATLNDPNMAALYLIVSFSVISILSFQLQKKVVVNFTLLLVLVALILTASRGGILSLGVGFLFVFCISIFSGRIKDLLVFLGISIVFSFLLLWLYHSTDVLNFAMERVSEISVEEEGTSRRLFLWSTAILMWEQSPLIGVGIGQYIPYSNEVVGYTISNIPHNTYLTFLAETGIFGFLAFLWFPIYLFLSLTLRFITSGARLYFYVLIGFVAISIQALSINVENIRFIWIFYTLIYYVLSRIPNEEIYQTRNRSWKNEGGVRE